MRENAGVSTESHHGSTAQDGKTETSVDRFDPNAVVETMMDEIRACEIAHAEDYEDDYIDHVVESTGDRPPDAVLNDPMRSKDFQKWLRGHLKAKAVEIQTVLAGMAQDGRIHAWRAIVADEGWEPGRDRHVGVHWTYTEYKAEPYDAGDGTHLFVVEAMVPETSIDWTETVIHHMTRDEEENEITLLRDAQVTILSVTQKPYRECAAPAW